MPEKNELIEKINSFLEKNDRKAKPSSKSIVPLKKIMGCDWGKEQHLREVALGCFAELAEADDDMSNAFMTELYKQAKVIGENVIKMYMVDNDNDMLPPRG